MVRAQFIQARAEPQQIEMTWFKPFFAIRLGVLWPLSLFLRAKNCARAFEPDHKPGKAKKWPRVQFSCSRNENLFQCYQDLLTYVDRGLVMLNEPTCYWLKRRSLGRMLSKKVFEEKLVETKKWFPFHFVLFREQLKFHFFWFPTKKILPNQKREKKIFFWFFGFFFQKTFFSSFETKRIRIFLN